MASRHRHRYPPGSLAGRKRSDSRSSPRHPCERHRGRRRTASASRDRSCGASSPGGAFLEATARRSAGDTDENVLHFSVANALRHASADFTTSTARIRINVLSSKQPIHKEWSGLDQVSVTCRITTGTPQAKPHKTCGYNHKVSTLNFSLTRLETR